MSFRSGLCLFTSRHLISLTRSEKKGFHLTHDDFDIISGANIILFFFFVFLVLDLEASQFHTSIECECVNLCVPDSGRLLGEHREFNREQFQLMMRGEMLRYFRWQLKKAAKSGTLEFPWHFAHKNVVQMNEICKHNMFCIVSWPSGFEKPTHLPLLCLTRNLTVKKHTKFSTIHIHVVLNICTHLNTLLLHFAYMQLPFSSAAMGSYDTCTVDGSSADGSYSACHKLGVKCAGTFGTSADCA